jgi:hypothetical protein
MVRNFQIPNKWGIIFIIKQPSGLHKKFRYVNSVMFLRINRLLSQTAGHAAGGAVGCGTALQIGMSRVRFPMVSLEYFH